MSPHVLRLHHAGVVVQDLQASIVWYRDHLGFQHQYSFTLPSARVTIIARGDARLELFEVEGAAPIADERKEVESMLSIGGVNHFGLVVDDLDGIVGTLTEKGVEIVIAPSPVPNGSGDRFAYIRDNERMLVELFQSAG
jgi:catechol 2,3-dioxygenase-like lactoylglutathione lyase family enzyme